MLEVVAWNY